MSEIELGVSEAVLEANPTIPPGEPFVHGLYENTAGNSEEFVPGHTDECPLCFAKLERFNVTHREPNTEPTTQQPLLQVCPECQHVPYKHESVELVASQTVEPVDP